MIEFVASASLNHHYIVWLYKEGEKFMKRFIIAIIVALCFSIPAFSISKQEAEKMVQVFLERGTYIKLDGYETMDKRGEKGFVRDFEYLYKSGTLAFEVTEHFFKIVCGTLSEKIEWDDYDMTIDKNGNLILKLTEEKNFRKLDANGYFTRW